MSWPALSTTSVWTPFADKPYSVGSLYVKSNTLREGQFAIVKAATHQMTGKECALEIINRAKVVGREDIVKNELKIMRNVNHPNIIKLIKDFENTAEVIIELELLQVIYMCVCVCVCVCCVCVLCVCCVCLCVFVCVCVCLCICVFM